MKNELNWVVRDTRGIYLFYLKVNERILLEHFRIKLEKN